MDVEAGRKEPDRSASALANPGMSTFRSFPSLRTSMSAPAIIMRTGPTGATGRRQQDLQRMGLRQPARRRITTPGTAASPTGIRTTTRRTPRRPGPPPVLRGAIQRLPGATHAARYDFALKSGRPLTPNGGTNQPIGIAWDGNADLDLTAQCSLKTRTTPAKKVLIVMSDGLNTQNRWPTYGNGQTQFNGQIDARQRICATTSRPPASSSTRCM